MTEPLKLCLDRVLPTELEEEAMRIAIEENPANLAMPASPDEAPDELKLALDAQRKWKPGRILNIRFRRAAQGGAVRPHLV
jgi:hypothetical protein